MELAGKDGMDKAAVLKKMEENIAAVNVDMPNYSKISGVKLVPEEFEKTPKKSIKRYMYQNS
jgi:long-chain acyl-CoA synthetase